LSKEAEATGKGKIVVLVAPSGAGKTTLAHMLLNDFEKLRFSVSATTRPPRKNERDGVDYHFLKPEAFEQAIQQGNFIEWEEFYGGKRYGTLKSEVDKQLDLGYFVLLDVEVNGAMNVKRLYDENCLSVFIKPPSMEILEQRLKNRRTEDQRSLQLRLERAKKEITFADKFDKVIINDDLERAYSELKEAVSDFMQST
jgi:guanylate kinase